MSKQLLDVTIAEPNAAVGGVVANGIRAVGAVNAETPEVQTDPARAERIVSAGADDEAGLVVRGIFEAFCDLELAARTGAQRRPNGGIVDFDDAVVFDKGQFAVADADDDAAVGDTRPALDAD